MYLGRSESPKGDQMCANLNDNRRVTHLHTTKEQQRASFIPNREKHRKSLRGFDVGLILIFAIFYYAPLIVHTSLNDTQK